MRPASIELPSQKGRPRADYDHDGFVDLFVSNQNGVNFLYHNNGDGTFTEVARQAGVQAPSSASPHGFSTTTMTVGPICSSTAI